MEDKKNDKEEFIEVLIYSKNLNTESEIEDYQDWLDKHRVLIGSKILKKRRLLYVISHHEKLLHYYDYLFETK